IFRRAWNESRRSSPAPPIRISRPRSSRELPTSRSPISMRALLTIPALAFLFLSALAFLWSRAGRAQEPAAAVAARLPLIPAKQQAEALKTLRTLDGFRMDLLASEPLVTSPVAMVYDENGLAYVVEMYDYPYSDKAIHEPWKENTKDLPL